VLQLLLQHIDFRLRLLHQLIGRSRVGRETLVLRTRTGRITRCIDPAAFCKFFFVLSSEIEGQPHDLGSGAAIIGNESEFAGFGGDVLFLLCLPIPINGPAQKLHNFRRSGSRRSLLLREGWRRRCNQKQSAKC
jgi:hypothetical protein